METLEAIRTRRSIRKYTETPVSDDAIKTLLEAAMTAPAAGNEQPIGHPAEEKPPAERYNPARVHDERWE